jgi:hypothetical protein
MNFKNKVGYKKWLAYGHMHGDFAKTPGHQPVSIKGKSHKVEHEKKARKGISHMAKGK